MSNGCVLDRTGKGIRREGGRSLLGYASDVTSDVGKEDMIDPVKHGHDALTMQEKMPSWSLIVYCSALVR